MDATILIPAITGGLVGAISANYFTIWRDRRARLHTFRSYIRSVTYEIEAININTLQAGQLFDKHQTTIHDVRLECAKAFEDVWCCRRSKFESAWLSYCGLRQQDVEPREYYDPTTAETNVLPKYSKGLERITGLLNEMIEYAR